MNNEKPDWSQATWDRIHKAVHDECMRTKVVRNFLPFVMTDLTAKTFPSDTVIVNEGGGTLSVDEAATVAINELVVEFSLTEQQVADEQAEMTAVTLATRAANLISQAEDSILLEGQRALTRPLFADGRVALKTNRSQLGNGLLDAPQLSQPGTTPANNIQIIQVPALDSEDPKSPPRWGEHTTAAVFDAYARLQGGAGLRQAHYGPYFLVLFFSVFADTHAPLENTLIMPADRIKALLKYGHDMMYMHPHSEDIRVVGATAPMLASGQMHCHFYGTGTVGKLQGLFGSLGGNTMDLVVGKDTTTQFLTKDSAGNYLFRVWERFALRLKDPSSIIVFDFSDRKNNSGTRRT
ncbi:MAG: hypothetical protein WC856_03080 [Methylococcaceae bacterium]|jgi:hypothetical protein